MKKTTFIFLIFGTVTLFIVLVLGYSLWNTLDPELTCTSCHEIEASHQTWSQSAHASVGCVECHGTALSEGYHSFKEKVNMVITHCRKPIANEEIRLNEAQILRLTDRCVACHRDEGAKWQMGRHSTTYHDIFANPVHNAEEPPYADCFRCHGMFYDNDITALLDFSAGYGSPNIVDQAAMTRPAIPCLACHQMHTESPPKQKMEQGNAIGQPQNPKTGLYIRSEKMFLRSDHLPRVQMTHKGEKAAVAEDGNTWLCIQCHAPNARHEAGTNDDRTPAGLFEGFSCIECHDPHSNQVTALAIARYRLSAETPTGRCVVSLPSNDECYLAPTGGN